MLNNVYTRIVNSTFFNNFSSYAIYIHSEDQKPLLKIDVESASDYRRLINGIVGGVWGSMKFEKKRNAGCCGRPATVK